MLCDIIQLRQRGLRLRESEWPEPVRGNLVVADSPGQHNNFRRHLRQATLFVATGVSGHPVPVLRIFDPELLHTTEDGFLVRGVEITVGAEKRIFEVEQMWLVRPQPGAESGASRQIPQLPEA